MSRPLDGERVFRGGFGYGRLFRASWPFARLVVSRDHLSLRMTGSPVPRVDHRRADVVSIHFDHGLGGSKLVVGLRPGLTAPPCWFSTLTTTALAAGLEELGWPILPPPPDRPAPPAVGP